MLCGKVPCIARYQKNAELLRSGPDDCVRESELLAPSNCHGSPGNSFVYRGDAEPIQELPDLRLLLAVRYEPHPTIVPKADPNRERPIKLFYSDDYVAAAESFDTTRKSGWIAESLALEPVEGVDVVAPAPLGFEDVAAVHERTYVNAVLTGEPRRLAQAQGFEWDPGMWRSVTASNGGVVAAARAAITEGVSGSLSSGLHHARFESGSSFCTFNGLVIAARAVLAEGVKSVLVLDLDAHCGGGTHSLIADDSRIRQVDVSVCPIDTHRPAPDNVCEMVTDASMYLGVIERQLELIDRSGWIPGLCLYNAGMDPVETCSIGGLTGITPAILQKREAMVFEWLAQRGIPVAFVLAGGYSMGRLTREGLVALHRHTIEEAARRAPARPRVRSSDASYIMSVPGQPVPR